MMAAPVDDPIKSDSRNDQELIAAALSPGLTTVALPHYAMGEWALRALLERIENSGPGAPAAAQLMPCPLVRRASVGPPPRYDVPRD